MKRQRPGSRKSLDSRMAPLIQQGKDAAAMGLSTDDCPFLYDLFRRSAWLIGHENYTRQNGKTA